MSSEVSPLWSRSQTVIEMLLEYFEARLALLLDKRKELG